MILVKPINLIRPVYNKLIRMRLPRKRTTMGGVVTKGVRFLDITDVLPHFKEVNIEMIQEHLSGDDTVVEIGTGHGVCTIWAARTASNGKVVSYEASKEMVEIARDALDVNSTILGRDLNDQVTIKHALIGDEVDVWGESAGVESISPTELPPADALIMDCEGSELGIIQQAKSLPDTVIVEAHPNKGVDPDNVVSELKSRGFEIKDLHPDNPDNPFVYIIAASKNRT